MSYRRKRKSLRASTFEAINVASGRTIAHLTDAEHVREFVGGYSTSLPDVSFIGYDDSGYQVREWSLGEVLNGTFDRDVLPVRTRRKK